MTSLKPNRFEINNNITEISWSMSRMLSVVVEVLFRAHMHASPNQMLAQSNGIVNFPRVHFHCFHNRNRPGRRLRSRRGTLHDMGLVHRTQLRQVPELRSNPYLHLVEILLWGPLLELFLWRLHASEIKTPMATLITRRRSPYLLVLVSDRKLMRGLGSLRHGLVAPWFLWPCLL